MIPEEYKTTVITSGIAFMKSITEAYGSDEGMKLWDAITDTLDPDVKGKIFLALMTGDYSDKVTLRSIDRYGNYQKITAIKTVREYTGLGLIDAKMLIERVADGMITDVKLTSAEQRNSFVRDIRSCGIIV